MGAFADLFRPSPNHRHSSSPSKQPQSLSTLDVPLPRPLPLWALATEPDYGSRLGPRDMRTAGRGETGPPQARRLKKVDRQGVTAETGYFPGQTGRGDVFHATGDFGMKGLSVSDSPGPSTYPPRPPYPPSTSYNTPPPPAPWPGDACTPNKYSPSAPSATSSPRVAPLVPLDVAVNSHRTSLPFYTSPNASPTRPTFSSARTSPQRPLPPTPPPFPPRPPSHQTSPHPSGDSRPVHTPMPSSLHSWPGRIPSQPAPILPTRPPQYPQQRLQQPSPTARADRTNAGAPSRTSTDVCERTPHVPASPPKSKRTAKQPVVLDVDSSSDSSFIDDSALTGDDENDLLLEELRESIFRGKKSNGKDPIKAVAARKTPVSTPSPQRRRRELSASSRPGQQRQCSGITSAGRRCTRSCSPSFGMGDGAGDEGVGVGFCKQHAKTALKDKWISESLSVETQALLRHYMAKPVSEKDEDGYIYIHELLSSPHSATLPTAHLKLGRSIHPLLRLSQHRRTNTSCPLLGEPIVRYTFPPVAEKGGKNSHRWERLCLVELAGRALSARKEEGKCRECGKRHLECFEVERAAVSMSGGGAEWSVREVVKRWERWCSDIIG